MSPLTGSSCEQCVTSEGKVGVWMLPRDREGPGIFKSVWSRIGW